MGMHRARQVFSAGAELHGDDGFGDQMRRLGTKDVHAQQAIGASIGDDLHEAVDTVDAVSSRIGTEQMLAGAHLVTCFLRRGFAEPNRGDLGVRVDDIGNRLVVDR